MTEEDFKRDIYPFKNKIFRFAKRLLGIPAEAEDVTQDVFMKLWNKRNEKGNIRSIEAFAMTVTKNICLDKIKSKRAVVIEFPHNDTTLQMKVPTVVQEFTDQKKIIEHIINGLPDQQRMIIQLREIEGYEFAQIAEIIGMNENTIRVNLSRARKTIKEELSKMHEYGLKKS